MIVALKKYVYKITLYTLVFLLYTSSYGQGARKDFQNKFDSAMEVLYDDPSASVKLVLESFDLARKAGDMWAMAIAKSGMGFISYELGDYKKSYTNYYEALMTLEKSDTIDLYNKTAILNELSLIQSDFNNHDESIKYSELALKSAKQYIDSHKDHADENGLKVLLVEIPYYMAIEYQAKGAHQTAGKILFELWEKAEDKNDVATYAQVLNELGIIKRENGEYAAAQEFLGLVVSGVGVSEIDKQIAYHNLANTYKDQGEFEKAESYFLIGLDLSQRLEDAKAQFLAFLDIGELKYKQENTHEAISYWHKALSVYDNIEAEPELYSVYNWLQLAYMDVDVEKAKEYNLKYSELNSFYVKNQTVQRELEVQNREELNAWIDQQRQDRVDAEERQRFIEQFWPVLLGVALLVLFSFILGIRYYWAMRTNRKLSRAQLSHVAQESGK